MDKFEIDDLQMSVAPTGTSDAVVGIPCFIVIRVVLIL